MPRTVVDPAGGSFDLYTPGAEIQMQIDVTVDQFHGKVITLLNTVWFIPRLVMSDCVGDECLLSRDIRDSKQ